MTPHLSRPNYNALRYFGKYNTLRHSSQAADRSHPGCQNPGQPTPPDDTIIYQSDRANSLQPFF
jgi:hypothetical protein